MGRWRRAGVVVATAVTGLAVALAGAGVQAQAAQQTLPASEKPLAGTARVMDGHIYGIASNGTTVVVGGDFTTVRNYAAGSVNQSRPYLFAYDQATGVVSQAFAPQVDGWVHAVEMTSNGTQVLVAGLFRTVNGTTRRGIVRLNLSDGSIDPTFKGQTSGGVLDMAVSKDEIVVGGYFDFAGNLRRPRLAALDPVTGLAKPGLDLPVSGVMNPAHPEHLTQVTELDISPDGRWLSVVGNFTTIGGVNRGQLALVDLDTYALADWSVPQFGTWPCSRGANIAYLNAAEFSPDSSYLVTGTMGAFSGGSASDVLCDTVARFELPPTSTGAVRPTWLNHTGGDSIFRVEVTGAAVYAGGHQRWLNNSNPSRTTGSISGDRDGPGSVGRYGIAALDPTSGVPLSWFPNRDGSRPTRGFEAIVPAGDQLLLGSDGTLIGGEVRQRLAAFTTAGGATNPAPESIRLPVQLYTLGSDSVVRASQFDGTTVSAPSAVSGAGVDGASWSTTGDGFLQRQRLTTFGTDGAYYRRTVDSAGVGPQVNLSATVGYVDDGTLTPFDQPYGVSTTRAAAYVGGRIIYTRSDSERLYWRWYSLESGIIGAEQFTLDTGRSWGSEAAAMEVVGDQLYVAERSGSLVRHTLSLKPASVAVVPGTRTVVDSGASGISWGTVRGLYAARSADAAAPETTLTRPAADGTAVGTSSVLAGAASDDQGVKSVEVTVQNSATGQYLQADGSLGAAAVALPARTTIRGDESAADWTLPVSLPDGPYTATAAALDAAGGRDLSPATRTFRVVTAEPDSTISAPAANATVATGPVTISGQAVDEVNGISGVEVSVRNARTLDWLQPDGSFAATFRWVPASLGTPGATTTTWSLPVTLGSDDAWVVQSRAGSPTGAREVTRPTTRFTTRTPSTDTVVPDSTFTSPTARSTQPVGPVRVTGAATDDASGVARVTVTVKDAVSGQWVQADGSLGAVAVQLPTTLTGAGTPAATWTLDLTLPAGDWGLTARAVDVAGNIETVKPFLRFLTA